MHTLAVFAPLDWAVVAAYFALVTIVGILVARKNAAQGEYFLANRSLPTWAVAVSLVATMLSTVTFVGVPDISFKGNISYLILNIGVFLAVFIVAFLFIPRLYKAGTVTIYGYIAMRFGETARIAISSAFIIGRLLASGARLFVAAIPLCYLMFGADHPTFPQFALAIALIGIIGTFYTAKGGVRAVVWVDTIQFAIVVGTAFLTIAILLHRIPLNLTQIIDFLQHPPSHKNKFEFLNTTLNPAANYTIYTAFLVVFLNAAAYGVDQDLAQRFMISKSALKGGISVIASQCIGIVVVSLFLLIGLLLFVFYKSPAMHAPAYGLPDAGFYPWFLFHELPTGIAGIAIAGFFAIAQGSLDSAMNAVASSIVADIYLPLRKQLRPAKANSETPPDTKASKLVVASVGLLMCIFALLCALIYDPEQRTLLDFVLGIMTFALSGMLAVFLTALFTKRGNAFSVIAALIIGAEIIALFQDRCLDVYASFFLGHLQPIAWPWWMPVATPIAFLVCITGKPRPHNIPAPSALSS